MPPASDQRGVEIASSHFSPLRAVDSVARRVIYLDYQATTPLAPEVVKAMQPWIEERFANPHSPSRWGNEAEAAIEVARKQVDKAIGLKGGGIAFTGSATEAINWALKGSVEKAPAEGKNARSRIVTVATEHAAVLDTCEWLAGRGIDLTVLPVGPDGRLDLELLARELDDGHQIPRGVYVRMKYMRIARDGVGRDQNGVSIGRALRGSLDRDRAVRAGPVLDIDLLAEHARQIFPDQPRPDVG